MFSLSLTFFLFACNKAPQIDTPISVSKVTKRTRASKCNLDLIIHQNSQGKYYVTCPPNGNLCYKSNGYLKTCELAELPIVLDYIANNDANSYFSTSGYQCLFPDVDDVSGLMSDITNNNVHLYLLDGITTSYQFVLSYASSQSGITLTNTLFAWDY